MKLFVKKAGNELLDAWTFTAKETGPVSEADTTNAIFQCLYARRWTGTKYMMVEKPK